MIHRQTNHHNHHLTSPLHHHFISLNQLVMVDQPFLTVNPMTLTFLLPKNAAVWSAWRAKRHLHRGRGRFCAAPHLGASAAAMLGDAPLVERMVSQDE